MQGIDGLHPEKDGLKMKIARRAPILAVIILVLSAAVIIAWPRRHEATFYPIGVIPFRIVAYERTAFQFRDDLEAVTARMAELVAVFNRHDPTSELARMNDKARSVPFEVGTDMLRIFELSRKWHRETNGAFDPSVGPLIDLWKGAGANKRLPTADEIAVARHKAGLDLVTTMGNGKISFTREGANLDFGAIAKGYMTDEAALVLKQRGVKRGLVQAGGDTLAFGDGTFRIGIQDPTAKSGEGIVGTIEMSAGAISTSGSYERFIEIDGERYSHIVDPRTGSPVDNGVVSATVIARTSTDADAIATALMVLGLSDSIDLIKRLERVEAILILRGSDDYDVWASASLVPRLTLGPDWLGRVHLF